MFTGDFTVSMLLFSIDLSKETSVLLKFMLSSVWLMFGWKEEVALKLLYLLYERLS